MRLRECFQKRLLRKERPDSKKSERSMQVAETRLDEAERALKHGLLDSTIILAYTAMFHAARAILFRDGIVEKSHVCLVEYLRETYANSGKLSESLVNALDTLRVDRHETLYGLETRSSRKEAQHSIRKAKEFLDAVREFVESSQT